MPETTDPQPDLPDRLEAVLTERFTELGNPFSAMRRQEKGPDGWPASHPVGPHHVAEVLRELLALAAPMPSSAPADRAELRNRIAETLRAAAFECDGKCGLSEQDCYDAHPISFSAMSNGLTHVTGSVTAIADAVLAVLPEPADRAAIMREAEAALRAQGKHLAGEFNNSDILHEDGPASAVATWQRAADLLRRMAVEVPAPNRAGGEGPRGCGCPNEDVVEHQFGTEGCTCIPFVREGGTGRYCQPGDTVDQIGGWERGGDCPHHRPTA